jgi:NAD(P)-dependent dehydrogenase (short-subunit alcohol dehydrogenase family)
MSEGAENVSHGAETASHGAETAREGAANPSDDATRSTPNRSVLVVGASRGLGEAIVENYVSRGARVVATARNDEPSPLREFARRSGGAVEIEQVDITMQDQIGALRERLDGRSFDLLFVVAGVSLAAQDAVGADIRTHDFMRMMDTNVLGVMRTVEALQGLVDPAGTIAVMSSGQGSIAGNSSGGFEVYRATKAALNQMFRSYAARHAGEHRALLLMAPGWVKTELGGPTAMLEIGESIPPLVDTVDAQHGMPGLRYLDRHGRTVAW